VWGASSECHERSVDVLHDEREIARVAATENRLPLGLALEDTGPAAVRFSEGLDVERCEGRCVLRRRIT
jgi:hypothetical protein